MLRLLFGVLGCGLVAVASATTTGPLAVEDRSTLSRGDEAISRAQATSEANENAMILFLQQFEQQQQEIAELRGRIEELTQALDDVRRAERERYLDLDGRISAIESKPAATSASGVPSPGANGGMAAVADNAGEQLAQETLYNEARTSLRNRDYAKAVEQFQQYLKNWPRGDFADYAHYWLGETYLTQGGAEQARASAEFKAVVDNFPSSQQTPRALYRLGQINLDANKVPEARQYFSRVVEQYPNSADAANAKAVLSQLK